MYGLPHCAVETVHLKSSGAYVRVEVVVAWWDDTMSCVWTLNINQHHPEANCTTCCTTCLRTGHTSLGVATKINLLSLSMGQWSPHYSSRTSIVIHTGRFFICFLNSIALQGKVYETDLISYLRYSIQEMHSNGAKHPQERTENTCVVRKYFYKIVL